MYICPSKSFDFDMDEYSDGYEYLDRIGASVELCESIFRIFHLNNFLTNFAY